MAKEFTEKTLALPFSVSVSQTTTYFLSKTLPFYPPFIILCSNTVPTVHIRKKHQQSPCLLGKTNVNIGGPGGT